MWGAQLHHHIWPSVTLKGQSHGSSDFEVTSRKRAELCHTLLLNTHRKPCMGSLVTPTDLAWSDMERSNSRSLRINIYLVKEQIYAIGNNRKSCMASLMVPSGLTLSGLEKSKFKLGQTLFRQLHVHTDKNKSVPNHYSETFLWTLTTPCCNVLDIICIIIMYILPEPIRSEGI